MFLRAQGKSQFQHQYRNRFCHIFFSRRDVRETLEVIDKDLSIFYTDLDKSENLIVKSEDDLFDDLKLLREKLQHRSDIIMQFAQNLDDTENMRSDVASKELKALVDKLIGIAHQLPDEIGMLLSRYMSSYDS